MTVHSDRDRLFVSYSRADRAWHDRVTTHLDTLHDILHVWSDELIRPGSNWREEIFKSLDDSQAAVLIVTANYLASRFVREHEIPRLLQRQSDEGLLVYPLIVEPCYWQRHEWLERMQARVLAPEEGPQPSSYEVEQKLTALTKEIAKDLRAARAAGGPRPDLQQRLDRVVSRLHSLQAAHDQTYDDEKWHLGPELDRLSDAIWATGNDPRWRVAHDHVRNAILLDGNPAELAACIGELEDLRS